MVAKYFIKFKHVQWWKKKSMSWINTIKCTTRKIDVWVVIDVKFSIFKNRECTRHTYLTCCYNIINLFIQTWYAENCNNGKPNTNTCICIVERWRVCLQQIYMLTFIRWVFQFVAWYIRVNKGRWFHGSIYLHSNLKDTYRLCWISINLHDCRLWINSLWIICEQKIS